MKTKHAPASFLVPQAIGRSEGDMIAHGHGEQLELFRETLTRPAKLQLIAMMGLSEPKHLDRSQYAKIADILRAMGYEPNIRQDGATFLTWMYEAVEETGLKLRQKSFPMFIREPAGYMKDGRRKWKIGLVDLSILQDFGFYYEDEEGQPINLKEIPEDQLIKYEAVKGKALFAIPMVDKNGNVIKNKDGKPRRRMANGVTWTFTSRIAKLAENRATAWVFYAEAVAILRRYLPKPASFDLILKTLFWPGSGLIEMSHDKLVAHLGIKTKDSRQAEAAIKAAFNDALQEGIINKPVTVRPKGYYQPSEKTGKPRRKDMVYQWKLSAKWQPARNLIAVSEDSLEANIEGQAEGSKNGKSDKSL